MDITRDRYYKISNMNTTDRLHFGPVLVKFWRKASTNRWECLVNGRKVRSFIYHRRKVGVDYDDRDTFAEHRQTVRAVLAFIAQHEQAQEGVA